ncbi:MAG: hypothetical protein B7Z55_03900 [Planctomycetales bacterium 12-60-4]|nr:MAG: hypothetical protein B7Z55_03900 [Planctomycetales bacterium 12-60-4]
MAVTDIDIEALFDRLANTEGKAEIIDGEVVLMSPTGPWSGYSAAIIFMSLFHYAKRTKTGMACTDGNTFRVRMPRRQSFSPDAAYFVGNMKAMKYYNGAPTFAVEVRSAGDYGPRADRQIAAKRSEYFAAGTLVVWEVDLLSQDVVKVYRSHAPETPTIYRPGDIAEAEPAVPGWTMPVNDLLPEDWAFPFDGEV